MEHAKHRMRMRERYAQQGGLEGFAPHEVLELWLYYAIPQKDINSLAHELLDRFGSLHAVLHAPADQLKQVKGIGEYSATFLNMFSQLNKYVGLERIGKRPRLSNRREAEEFCIHLLANERREMFYAICLTAQMQVIHSALVAKGSLSEVLAYPRVVTEVALTHNAHSVVLCHNHPGGSLVPSQGDVEVTRTLLDVLQKLEVVLADHIIVAEGRALSMLSNHFLEREPTPTGVCMRVADSAGETRIRHELLKREKSAGRNLEEI